MHAAFETLKPKLTKPSVLTDFNPIGWVRADASKQSVGVILLPEWGRDR